MLCLKSPESLIIEIEKPLSLNSRLKGRTLVCLSHLRWDLVLQRPQHLMTRFARAMPVYFVEEPVYGATDTPYLALHDVAENLTVIVPHMPTAAMSDAVAVQRSLLAQFFSANLDHPPVLWFYTPAAFEFANDLPAAITIFDCMDELSAFQGASPELRRLEAELLGRADIVFAGGISLYEAKLGRHPNLHAFPSAVEAAHFGKARAPARGPEPGDQRRVPHPRLGFFGVIDERLDRDLVATVARERPSWHLVLIGPVVKLDPKDLPRAPNIHYLGRKAYAELPAYVAGWDVAMLPFARNEATRFISPTKTPEYLAAGKPVVSTPILDVVRGWGDLDAVHIAATASEFIKATEEALTMAAGDRGWLEAADQALANISWDSTWTRMAELTAAAIQTREHAACSAGSPAGAAPNEVAVQFAKENTHV